MDEEEYIDIFEEKKKGRMIEDSSVKVMRIASETSKEERIRAHMDYAERFEKLFPELKVYSFDPGFGIVCPVKKRFPGGGLKVWLEYESNISFYMMHVILKSHGMHNPDLEIWE